ncbi:MAG TPA: proton-conducting transporter membrane subunit [Desulfobacterales bacterium]|nr:proton-conducting transporter membrane subunit [Desulfobacterales bacterium]
MGSLVALLVVLPLACSAAALIEKALPRLRIARPAAVAGLAGMAAILAATATPLMTVPAGRGLATEIGSWSSPIGIVLCLDGMAWVASLAVLIVCLAALLSASAGRSRGALYWFFFLVQVAGLEGALLTRDLFNLFVFLEVAGIAGCVLIAANGGPRPLLASLRYLVASTVSMALYLVGVYLLYRLTGSLSIDAIAAALGDPALTGVPSVRRGLSVAGACLVVGVGLRSAVVPLHAWLPAAHAEAPHEVSAMLSGAVLKVTIVNMVRLAPIAGPFLPQDLYLWAGTASALVGVAMALCQLDMKRLLAWSSVSQVGYIVAVLALSESGRSAAFAHLVSHALFKSLLFLSIGMVVEATAEHRIDRLGRLAGVLPVPFVGFLVGAAAIAGLPPFSGFASKKLVLDALSAAPAALWICRIVAVGTAASFLKLSQVFWSAYRGAAPSVRHSGVSAMSTASLALLAACCIAAGISPSPLIGALNGFLGLNAAAPAVYDAAALAESFITLGAGAAVFLIVRTRTAARIARTIRSAAAGFEGTIGWTLAGFAALAGVALIIAG